MKPPLHPARETSFSFSCSSCSRCCKEKIIRVNPYETTRLASFLRISTSDFVRTYTWAAGAILRMPYRGNCVFRNIEGCAVHESRPLVCRLYPLRRHTSEDGGETFDLLEFEPKCVGIAHTQGTIADYLSEQGALTYLDAVDLYVGLVDAIADALRQEIRGDSSLITEAALRCIAPEVNDPGPLPRWLDVDPLVSRYSASRGLPLPRTYEEKAMLHIEAVKSWLEGEWQDETDGLSSGASRPESSLAGSPSHRVTRIKEMARTLAVLGYSVGANLDELRQSLAGTGEAEPATGEAAG